MIPCRIANAQPTAAQADCANNPACAALYEQASQQFSAGQLADALHSFKLAYEVQADPRLLYSIARLMHLQRQETDAIPYYRRFIESGLDDDAQKAKAKEYLAQCEAIAAETLAKKAEEEKRKPVIPVEPVVPPPKPVPVYKKGWFWAVIGGSAAVVGLGVGLGVGLSNRGPSLPDGINTYAATF